MSLSFIVAVGENGVIGIDGDLPWRLPADLQRFKRELWASQSSWAEKHTKVLGALYPADQLGVDAAARKIHQDCLILGSLEEAVAKAKQEDEYGYRWCRGLSGAFTISG